MNIYDTYWRGVNEEWKRLDEEAMEKSVGNAIDNYVEFIGKNVSKDSATGKYVAFGKQFKREGQAKKFAMTFY